MTKLQTYLKAQNITGFQFAKKVGCNKTYIYALGQGKYTLSLKTAYKWSKSLGCNVEDIFSVEEYCKSL